MQQWVATYDGTGNGDDHAYAVRVDDEGSVYVTGRSSDGTSDNYATLKYNASGIQQWIHVWDGPRGLDDHARALALAADGSLYIGGVTSNMNGASRIAVLKLVDIRIFGDGFDGDAP